MAKTISIFFVSIFLTFIAGPSFAIIINSGFDYSFVYSAAEEEQNGEERKYGEKTNKLISKFFSFTPNLSFIQSKIIPEFQLNDWNTVYFELHSPPPEQA